MHVNPEQRMQGLTLYKGCMLTLNKGCKAYPVQRIQDLPGTKDACNPAETMQGLPCTKDTRLTRHKGCMQPCRNNARLTLHKGCKAYPVQRMHVNPEQRMQGLTLYKGCRVKSCTKDTGYILHIGCRDKGCRAYSAQRMQCCYCECRIIPHYGQTRQEFAIGNLISYIDTFTDTSYIDLHFVDVFQCILIQRPYSDTIMPKYIDRKI